MAAQHLTTVPLSEFPQAFQHEIDRQIAEIDHLVSRAFARVHLTTCDYESEWCDCHEHATVHQLATEKEYCLRHFILIEKEAARA